MMLWYQCPNCGSREKFEISVNVPALLVQPNGTLEDFAVELAPNYREYLEENGNWNDAIQCTVCGHAGNLNTFVQAANVPTI